MRKSSLLDTVGGTPLVRLRATETGRAEGLYAKLERFNPMGSIKDRIALAMVERAEARGDVRKGGTLVEPTSGNTGIGLAMVGAVKGYRVLLTMPDTMSIERRRLLTALGAELVLTPGEAGMRGAVEEANRRATSIPGAVVLGQFSNPANPDIHEQSTAPEIWSASEGRVDVVVAGIGTGGTITGVGRWLKRRQPRIRTIGVEPSRSPFLTEGRAGPHKIQGIGAGFHPPVLDLDVVDDVVSVDDEDAIQWTRHLARREGLFVGISSGAAVAAASRLARRPAFAGARMVVILPDAGERYLSSTFWEEAEDG